MDLPDISLGVMSPPSSRSNSPKNYDEVMEKYLQLGEEDIKSQKAIEDESHETDEKVFLF